MKRVRFSTQIDEQIDARLRRTLLGLARDGTAITLADATTAALDAWVTATLDAVRDGHEYPDVATRPTFRPGRPLSRAPHEE